MSLSRIFRLPAELVFSIIKRLDPIDLYRLSLVDGRVKLLFDTKRDLYTELMEHLTVLENDFSSLACRRCFRVLATCQFSWYYASCDPDDRLCINCDVHNGTYKTGAGDYKQHKINAL